MFLKSLVLRGFKSFADKTTLVLEPGVTVVVGPNGSGKSNVIDAISWVLGEQGPRALRGGKMEDVIFAGSRHRPALGMAEVTLAIDNAAGILPIEFSEVTISRTLFRSGESEYRLNGTPCRLLDIQEVLSDSGIGREQHTIIGQGQLDAVLTADPAQMRGFIEEAAGVAKHRRRKERALRKIGATEHNMVRLADLLAEIRRQLRPLREQAETARRHAALAEDLGRLRLVLAARELCSIRGRLGPGGALDLEGPIRAKEEELAGLERRLPVAEGSRAEAFAASEAAREAAYALSRMAERLGATARLAAERGRSLQAELAAVTEAAARAQVAQLEREASEVEVALAEATEAAQATGAQAAGRRAAVESADARLGRCEATLAPLSAGHRERISEAVRLRGEIAALESSLAAAEAERRRIEDRRRSLASARAAAAVTLGEARRELEELEGAEAPLAEAVGALEEEIERLEPARATALAGVREADREAAGWRARARVAAGPSSDGARRLAASGARGIAGVLADLVEGPAEYLHALEALAGPAAGVLVVADHTSAALLLAAQEDREALGILVAGGAGPEIPGARRLTDLVRCRTPEAERALAGIYVAEDAASVARMAAEHPGAIFVAVDGAVALGRLVARGAADAASGAARAEVRLAAAESRVGELEAQVHSLRSRWEEAAARLNEADAAYAAAGERLVRLEREVHALDREAEAIADAADRAEGAAGSLAARLESLRGSLPGIEGGVVQANLEVEQAHRDRARATTAREAAAAALDEARLGAARAAERLRVLQDRRAAVAAALEDAVRAASGIRGRRDEIVGAVQRVQAVARWASAAGSEAAAWAEEADRRYRASRRAVDEAEALVVNLRGERAGLTGELDELRARARDEDLQRSELRIRARILEERMRGELGADPDRTVARFGGRWEVEDESRLVEPLERIAAMEQEALRRRHARLERDLETMGRVNPLAAQEFDALTEREAFLADQLADLRSSRRDLLKVVAEVDGKVRELFGAAFDDVAREYDGLFRTLFPGGQGRLRLTDPSDLLATGVEVEARPGGKNLRRLSLLSGGEKALAALAVLFAIFRARPSPFYVLDEVEAALDDVNLHRFLELLQSFKDTSQLIVVTHQKRTMEAADVLYGVSIRPDGASRVVSQRLSPVEAGPQGLRDPIA